MDKLSDFSWCKDEALWYFTNNMSANHHEVSKKVIQFVAQGNWTSL